MDIIGGPVGILAGFFLFVIAYGFDGGTRTFIRVIGVALLFLQMRGCFRN